MDTANSNQSLQLTKGQQLLLAGQMLQPEDPLYNMAFIFRLNGAVDEAAFGRAFQALVKRCDALRMVILPSASGSTQRDLGRAAGNFLFLDLSSYEQPDQALIQWTDEHCSRQLDPSQSQFESALLKMGTEDYAWYFNQHHLFTDAWSVSLMFDKLAQLYRLERAVDGGESAPMPGIAETAANEQIDTAEVSHHAIDYWRKKQDLVGRAGRFYRDLPRNATDGRDGTKYLWAQIEAAYWTP